MEQTHKSSDDGMIHDDRDTMFGKMLGPINPDICRIGRTIKKSMSWVVGQYLSYIVRPRHDIQAMIHRRTRSIFRDIDKSIQSSIAVHYRSGEPDFNRRVVSLDVYMAAVKMKANELASMGRPVSVVYLASQDNNNNFHNSSYMQMRYGGNYTFKFLPPYAVSDDIDPSKEVEIELREHPLVPRQPYVVEFLSDFQLMVKADVFIGSVSTIYMIAMLLRYAKHPTRSKGHTCLIDSQARLICEDNDLKYDIYSNYNYLILGNGAGGEDRNGGLRGGTAF